MARADHGRSAFALLFLALATTTACSTASAHFVARDPASLSREARRGQAIYKLQCASCHGQGGDTLRRANLADARRIAAYSDDGLAAATADGVGRMQGFGVARGGPLTEADVSAVVAYLRTLSGSTLSEAR